MKGIKNLVLSFIFVLLLSVNINADGFVPNPVGDPSSGTKIGQVKVIVEDTIESSSTTIAPRGQIFADWVDLYKNDTMVNVIVRAANQNEIEVIGAPGYITGIDGLNAGDRVSTDGWMATLNDWFPTVGTGDVSTETTLTSQQGDLQDKDIIKVMFSLDFGLDLGGDYGNNDKSLKLIDFSKGKLNKTFESGTYKYDLKVTKGTKSVLVTPIATNKNFQCRIFVGNKEYRRTKEVSIKEGTKIKVVCGDPEWATMNNGEWGSGAEEVDPVTYTFTVKYPVDKELVKKDDKINNDKKDKSENNQELPKTGQNLNALFIVIAALATTGSTYLVLRRK